MMMKSDISGPFLLLLLLFSSSAPGLGSLLVKRYSYIHDYYTWDEAQSYCRSHYRDLATIYTESDVLNVDMHTSTAWIGLYLTTSNNSIAWRWSNGHRTFFTHNNWAAREPSSNDGCAFVSSTSSRYYGADCEDYKFFICCYYDSKDHYILRFIPQTKTWSEAQQFCRTQYSDLATIRYPGDLVWVSGLQDFMVWTGLHRDGGTWKWTKGHSEYRRWAVNEPGTNGNCVSVSSQSHLMWTQSCSARFPFICYSDNVILVKENKTWEEALEHCRALNAQYELVSVVPGTEHDFVMTKVTPANTEEVWIGLHYLAGGWLWVNGANVLYPDLPICPGFGQHCGALIKNNTGGVEARDCTERKNFLCYRKTF